MKSHSWDINAREYLLTEYGEMLFDAKRYRSAIEILNEMLDPVGFSSNTISKDERVSIYTVKALSLKYKSLNALIKETGSRSYTVQAIETGKILTSIFDQKKLEMSEDESRTNLSDSSRVFYTGLIENYCSLYQSDRDPLLLERAFEYSEKSKLSGFLAATREINATRFSVPSEQARTENELRKKIGLYSEFIANEKAKDNSDNNKITTWEREKFYLIRSRDSMDLIFEKKYPDFYKLKYRSTTTSINDVTNVIGSGSNLISYVLTDDKLYIFVINRLHKQIIVKNINSVFHNNLARFREIVSNISWWNGGQGIF